MIMFTPNRGGGRGLRLGAAVVELKQRTSKKTNILKLFISIKGNSGEGSGVESPRAVRKATKNVRPMGATALPSRGGGTHPSSEPP